VKSVLEELEREGAHERALLTLLDTVQVLVEVLAAGMTPNKDFEGITIRRFNQTRADLLEEALPGE
jgi:hypothetical protein